MKALKLAALLGAFFFAAPSFAAEPIGPNANRPEPNGYEEFLDLVFVRPFALAGTVATTGLFVGLSPLVGLATIIKPHDAFQKISQVLVTGPATYTFVRPLGNFD